MNTEKLRRADGWKMLMLHDTLYMCENYWKKNCLYRKLYNACLFLNPSVWVINRRGNWIKLNSWQPGLVNSRVCPFSYRLHDITIHYICCVRANPYISLLRHFSEHEAKPRFRSRPLIAATILWYTTATFGAYVLSFPPLSAKRKYVASAVKFSTKTF